MERLCHHYDQDRQVYFKSAKNWKALMLSISDSMKPKYALYIGSATDSLGGHRRIRYYTRRSDSDLVNFPRYMRQFLGQGYKIDKIAIMLRCAVPKPTKQAQFRVLFLTIEGLFAFSFKAMYTTRDANFGIQGFALWDHDELQHRGLCSHSPLHEARTDVLTATLDPAIAEELFAARKEREREKARHRYENMSEEAIEERRAKRRFENMSEEAIEERKASMRNENMSEEAIEQRRAKRRVENMSEEAIEQRRAKQRVENMSEEAREKKRTRGRIGNLSEEAREKKRANRRIENLSEEQIEKKRASNAKSKLKR